MFWHLNWTVIYVIPRFGEKFQTFLIVGWKHAAKTDKNKKSGRSTRDISDPSTLWLLLEVFYLYASSLVGFFFSQSLPFTVFMFLMQLWTRSSVCSKILFISSFYLMKDPIAVTNRITMSFFMHRDIFTWFRKDSDHWILINTSWPQRYIKIIQNMESEMLQI